MGGAGGGGVVGGGGGGGWGGGGGGGGRGVLVSEKMTQGYSSDCYLIHWGGIGRL